MRLADAHFVWLPLSWPSSQLRGGLWSPLTSLPPPSGIVASLHHASLCNTSLGSDVGLLWVQPRLLSTVSVLGPGSSTDHHQCHSGPHAASARQEQLGWSCGSWDQSSGFTSSGPSTCLIQGNWPFIFELLLVDLMLRWHHPSGDIPVDNFISAFDLLPGQCRSLFQKSIYTLLYFVSKEISLKMIKIFCHFLLILGGEATRGGSNWISNISHPKESIRIKINVHASMIRNNAIVVLQGTKSLNIGSWMSACHTTLHVMPGQLVFGRDMVLNTQYLADRTAIKTQKQDLIRKNTWIENSKRIPHQYWVGDQVMWENHHANKYE